jgi:AAA-ATPase Vps4-associated protein 1
VHLTDPGFATAVAKPEATTGKVVLGEEELNRIKAEWEESQRKKKEKEEAAAKEKEKAKEKEGGAGILGWLGGGSNNASSSTSTSDAAKKTPPAALFASPNSTPAAHQRFILNRQIFAMRQAELRKKRATTRVNALAPRLPGVPRNL